MGYLKGRRNEGFHTKEAWLDLHSGKVIILTRGRDTCEEAVREIREIMQPCPVQLMLGHVTWSGQWHVNWRMSIPSSLHSPQVTPQAVCSLIHNDQQCCRQRLEMSWSRRNLAHTECAVWSRDKPLLLEAMETLGSLVIAAIFSPSWLINNIMGLVWGISKMKQCT